jgi:8-oxo-dGTP pyrophosphatase MutT (NUDIX family)
MIDENRNPWKIKSSKVAYENEWITLTHEEVITPSGSEGVYGRVHMKNHAIGVIPLDEDGNTWLVGQYRYPLNAYSWEIPEGGGLRDEDIMEAAKRELKEEVGLIAKKWTQLCVAHTSNSVTDETAFLFVAQELSHTETDPDDTEQLQIKKVSLNEAFEMAMDGRITDAMSLIALFRLKLMIHEKKIIL